MEEQERTGNIRCKKSRVRVFSFLVCSSENSGAPLAAAIFPMVYCREHLSDHLPSLDFEE